MKMVSIVKSIGIGAFGIIIWGVIIVLGFLIIAGLVWIGDKILPWLMLLSIITLATCIFILTPLVLIRRIRPWIGAGYLVASYVFGLTGWVMGLILTWVLWGGLGTIIGLGLGGVGVVLTAILATLFKGMWTESGFLILSTILTFGFRFLFLQLAKISHEEGSSYGY
jgi:hypothetical protein